MIIVIEREREDWLHKERYEFRLIDEPALILDMYQVFERATPRRQYKLTLQYVRNFPQRSDFSTEEVSLPDDVRAEALRQLFDLIVVSK